MVKVEFERSSYDFHKVGPVPWIEMRAGCLRLGPDNRTAARYHDGVWSVEGGSNVTKLRIDGSGCMIRFGGYNTNWSIHGPFDKVEVVDGAIYTQPDRHLLARLDEGSQLWFTYDDRRYWPVLVIRDDEKHQALPTSEPGGFATASRPRQIPSV
jgi:hypothetical protein